MALARTVQARGQVADNLLRLERQVGAEGAHGGEARGGLDMEARMRLLYYLDRSEGRIAEQRTLLNRWDQEVARVQAKLRQASARRRALERLRERRRDEYQQDEQRQMDRALDEHVTICQLGKSLDEDRPISMRGGQQTQQRRTADASAIE